MAVAVKDGQTAEKAGGTLPAAPPEDWLAPKPASHLIDHPGCKDRRKLRLLAAVCARRMLAALPADPALPAIVVAAERYADDPPTRPPAVPPPQPPRPAPPPPPPPP